MKTRTLKISVLVVNLLATGSYSQTVFDPVWVDFALPCFTCGDGSFANPYNTFQRALGWVIPGGTMGIKAGTSGNCCNCSPARDCFPITITNNMTIQAFGGPVTLGQ